MMDENATVVISKDSLKGLVEGLLSEREVVGVVPRDGKFAFDRIESPSELCLDYDVTLLSLRQFVLPTSETLFRYGAKDGIVAASEEDAPLRAIVGAHPYDIKALELLDEVYLGDFPDPNYRRRRENTLLVGVDCLNPSPYSFSASLGTNVVDTGFDLMLTDIGDSYVIAIGSDKGKDVLQKYVKAAPAGSDDLAKRDSVREKSAGKYELALNMSPQEIPSLLDANYDHPLWEEKGAKCLSCSSCTMVCPTCVCFDVRDEPDLTLTDGQRQRTWDSCMLVNFAKVATGENFREDGTARLRHRLHRKGKYMLERYGVLGCVGCGRCVSACLPDIASPVEVYNTMKEG
jgi:ferredoxin